MSNNNDLQDGRSAGERFLDRIEHRWRRWKNEPMCFPCAADGEGEDVGYPLPVTHPSFHDMADHAIDGVLTTHLLLGGAKFNAYRELFSCRVARHCMLRIIQPVRTNKPEETGMAA